MPIITSIRIEPEVRKELKLLSVQEDLPIGDLIEKLLKYYLIENYKGAANVSTNKTNAKN